LVPIVKNKFFKVTQKFEIKLYGEKRKATVFMPWLSVVRLSQNEVFLGLKIGR